MAKSRRSRRITHPKKRAFLAAYAQTGNVTAAAEAAGIARRTHYDWLESDPVYAEAFAEAQEKAIDLLELEARRRALEGVDEPVFYKGVEVGAVRKYSDTLLIFLLKGYRPERYKERVAAEHSGPDGGPIEHKHEVDLSKLSTEELRALARILDKASPNP